MKTATTAAIVLPVVGVGAALIWYGLGQSSEAPKVLAPVSVAPEDKDLIPVTSAEQTEDGSDKSATYAQLLTAYKQELQKWQSVRDAAFDRMKRIEQQASQVCRDFAWNATWSYKYNAIGIAGWTVWSKSQPKSLLASCTNYVTGAASSPGTPKIKAPPQAGANWMDHSWEDIANSIRQLQAKVADAKALLPDLRKRYQAAKAEHDAAQKHVREMERKLADLHAQGVY